MVEDSIAVTSELVAGEEEEEVPAYEGQNNMTFSSVAMLLLNCLCQAMGTSMIIMAVSRDKI